MNPFTTKPRKPQSKGQKFEAIPLLDLRRQYQQIRTEVLAAIERVCASQSYILGPEVEALESEVANFTGVAAAVGCASGTDALWLALLAAGVQRLQDGGGTALYQAIYSACKERLMKDDSDRPVRRALVVVSDGEDNQSEVSKMQAIEMAQRAQVIIYTISTDDSGLILRGDKVLQQLADATGGRAFFPFKMKDIKSSFSAIEDELRSQYVVSYHPADFNTDGRYRSIEITALKKDLQVRARKGYFAPQQ